MRRVMRCFVLCSLVLVGASCAAPSAEMMILDPRAARQAGLLTRANIPYVLEYRAGSGALLIYGAEHIADPAHPQVADISRRWAAFAPTAGFVEGRYLLHMDNARAAVQRGGEAGLVVHLAGLTNTPVASFEPSRSAELAELRQGFSDDRIAVFYILRIIRQEVARGRAGSTDSVATAQLQQLRQAGLTGAPSTFAELEASARRLLPELTDFRQAPQAWFSPTDSGRFTNEIAHASAKFRNRHIFHLLLERVSRGERLFSAMGASHAVELEPALSAALGPPRLKQAGGGSIK